VIRVRVIGCVLLVSGWGIVMAAVVMLRGWQASVFIGAGCAVEALGLGLLTAGYRAIQLSVGRGQR
jgi:hypothetical protein